MSKLKQQLLGVLAIIALRPKYDNLRNMIQPWAYLASYEELPEFLDTIMKQPGHQAHTLLKQTLSEITQGLWETAHLHESSAEDYPGLFEDNYFAKRKQQLESLPHSQNPWVELQAMLTQDYRGTCSLAEYLDRLCDCMQQPPSYHAGINSVAAHWPR